MGEVISLDNSEIIYASSNPSRRLELPSVEHAPILKEFGRLGLDRFMDRYAIPTQTDERGFVDYGWLLGYIHSLVSKDHVWTGGLDVHHLQWVGKWYDESHFQHEENPSVPSELREIPFHKLLIPRDLHDLIHVVTLPPEIPEYEQMRRRVEAFTVARSLFQKAKQTIEIESKERRLIPAPHPKYHSKTFDPVTRKLIEREVLIDQYNQFRAQFENELSSTTQQDVDDFLRISSLQDGDPIVSLVSTFDRTVKPNKRKQGIRPKLRWHPERLQRPA